jgi:hypothetical protein
MKITSFIHCHLYLPTEMQNIQLPTAEEQLLPTFSYNEDGTWYITQHKKF